MNKDSAQVNYSIMDVKVTYTDAVGKKDRAHRNISEDSFNVFSQKLIANETASSEADRENASTLFAIGYV